jgi:DHA1 family tetracycline resistance protein-like MFS transporter
MSSAQGRQPAIVFIFITLVLAVVGFGLLIPVLPKIVVQLQGGAVSEGSHTYGWIISSYALMQFVFSPILGALSDQFGRRRIILIATAGSAIDYVIMALAPTLGWFFLARIIAGGTAGVLSTANAYIADITPPEKRAQSFGLLGAAFGIGFVIGPVLGGVLGNIDLRLPFWVAAGCSAVNWLWGCFVLPESLKPENRRKFEWSRANPVGALLALKRFPAVLGLVECYFIFMLAQAMIQTTWALYTDYRYQWTPLNIGLSLMLAGVLTGLVQAVVVKKAVPVLGETRAVLVGFIVSIVAQLCYAMATQGWMIYAIICFGAFSGIAGPALQAYITKHVPANEQGAVQGVYAGLASLAGVPGPVIGTWAFGSAVDPDKVVHLNDWFAWLEPALNWCLRNLVPHHPGASFFLGAMFSFGAMLLAWRSFRRDQARESTEPHAT